MLRHERRLLIDCLGIGLALTLLVVAADIAGLLLPLENFLHDTRARFCQLFTKTPTDTLVHLDLDDNALDVVGRWPWPRARLAQVLDEVRLAGPRAFAMDVLLSEPQEIEYVPLPDDAAGDANAPATAPSAAATSPTASNVPSTTYASPTTAPVACVPFDNDAELARSIERLGNVIIPATLEPVPRWTARYRALVDKLTADLELEEQPLLEWLRADGQTGSVEYLRDLVVLARRDAIQQRLAALNPLPNVPFAQVRAQLVPRTPPELNTGVVNVVREQWTRFLAARAFSRFSLPRPPDFPTYAQLRFQLAPVRALSDAAAGGAFANHIQFGSPVVRSLPILMEEDGRVYAQMGLALAARMLDLDLERMRIERNRLLIPRRADQDSRRRDLAIPLAPPETSTTGVTYVALLDIPWFGGHQWETMYDWRAHATSRQHLPLNQVWQTCVARQKVIRNNRAIDDAVLGIFWGSQDAARIEKYKQAIAPEEDFASREKIARELVLEWSPFMPDFEAIKPQEKTERDVIFLASFKALRDLLRLTPQLVQELADFRALLAAQLKGKAVLMGWTATAAIADFVPTSLHEKAPGVVVHGVIYNGIMTGELWGRPPWWIGDVFALLMGIGTAFTVGYFSPIRGLAVALALVLGYTVLNGFVLFDLANMIVGAAAPLTCVVIVWGMCTLTRIRVEQIERNRITRRFSSYADSRLVDYVLESEQLTFEGEDREVTIVFTDLAGFTTLSERLGARVVPVLNELLDELVPVIREHHSGYVNKFIGDGIMFFYNAPLRHPDHASEAVDTVLDMHRKLAEFNLRLRERGLPELAMRGGIASGVVVVGDAGGGGRSDYTCLGDAVNLSSRLEAANKQTGTRTLMNSRARELLNGAFLLRPVGKLKVVGKDEAVMCYEPLARADDATEAQKDLADLSGRMVEAFLGRRFDESSRCADDIDAKHGPSKLTAIYRAASRQYLQHPPPPDFDGRIVLTEK